MKNSVKFVVSESQEPKLSIGGAIRILDESQIACFQNGAVNILQLSDGSLIQTLKFDEDDVAYCLTTLGDKLWTGHKSGLVREHSNGQEMRHWNPKHTNPLIHLAIDKADFISVSADRIIKHWDLLGEGVTCKGVFRGCVSLPTVVLIGNNQLFVGTDSGKIHIWTLDIKSSPLITLEKHYSTVDRILLSDDYLFTYSRDKIIVSWDKKNAYKPLKVVPTLTDIHSLELYNENFLIAGDNEANLRLYHQHDLKVTDLDRKIDENSFELGPIREIIKVKDGLLFVQDGLFSILDDNGLKTFPTNVYEILDLLILQDKYLVTAHNSPDFNVYNIALNTHKLVRGHNEAIVALSGRDNMILSGSKDKTAILWKLNDNLDIEMLGVCKGHATSVTSVAFNSLTCFFTISKDSVLKVWSYTDSIQSHKTILAHEGSKGEVNSLDLSVDGRLLATGAMDKTAKIWNTVSLEVVATLTGHRRGIWCVKFSEFDKILLTSSTDGNVKIWELNGFSCLKTLQGHESSVLKCGFYNKSTIMSVSSDGLLKLWNTESGECAGTFDGHEDQVWACYSMENCIYTGGADGRLLKWNDITEESNLEEIEAKQKQIKKEQSLDNFFQQKNWVKAFKYSIRMNKPRRALSALVALYENDELESAFESLSPKERNTLTGLVSNWNTFGQHAFASSVALNALIKSDNFIEKDHDSKTVASLLSYSKKHLERIRNLERRLAVVDLLVDTMK
ncbi:transducin beta-like protein 3 [Lepeophtheirus salmonis]|uniref:transducin beta-like protein 3 n=1 Tax=Lepeophtheirus salmonis TaxID=72036 RepID=UPI001AE68D6D|nr:transducin beta-like protein 3 [Lepeophtheirus salmonis]